MISPLSIASDGYLCRSESTIPPAVNGYLCFKAITPDIDEPVVTKKQSGGYKGKSKPLVFIDPTKEQEYINKLIIKEEEEILTFIKVFLKCH